MRFFPEPLEPLAMPQIWIRVDAAGLQPVMVDEQQELPCAGDVDWHFVAVVEDPQEARKLTEQLCREHGHHEVAASDSQAIGASQVQAAPGPPHGGADPRRRATPEA